MPVLLEQLIIIAVQFALTELEKGGVKNDDAMEAIKQAMTKASIAHIQAKYPNG